MQGLKITAEDVRLELQRRKYNAIERMFPEKGPLAYSNYPKHMEFIRATATQKESAFIAANRAGKTETGAYAVAVWLTGKYPKWWDGKRFAGPVNILVSGETAAVVRDSIQQKLLGPIHDAGSGMIPRDAIIERRSKMGVADAIDTVRVRHVSGGESVIQFQSYDQGREKFQATSRSVVWFDEEPPMDIYAEGLIRTMTTQGVVISTFTPLKGLSETVLFLQEKAERGACSITTATWDDAPHLSAEDKAALWEALPPHQREARSKGIPQLGSGAIYPVPEADFVVPPFDIPPHFFRAYGLDVGWNNTAFVMGAHDRDNDVVYITSDYKRGQSEPASHAEAIKRHGKLMGAIDPASAGSSQVDGKQLMDLYRQLGLELVAADNSVESGIFDIYNRLVTGRLKVFSSCQLLLAEYRQYRRDEKGRVVKLNDHIMDALRYYIRTGLSVGRVASASQTKAKPILIKPIAGSYMGV